MIIKINRTQMTPAQINPAWITDTRMTAAAFRVLCYIAHMNRQHRTTTSQTIGHALDMDAAEVDMRLGELADLGHIDTTDTTATPPAASPRPVWSNRKPLQF